MDATRDEQSSTPGGLELPQSSTFSTHAGLETQHSTVLNPAAADSTSAAAAATFSHVSAVIGAITLFARAYGGTVVGDIVLEAARVLGHLGRGGGERGLHPCANLYPSRGDGTAGADVATHRGRFYSWRICASSAFERW